MTPLEGREFQRMGIFSCQACHHIVFWNRAWMSYQCHKDENQCDCDCYEMQLFYEPMDIEEMGC